MDKKIFALIFCMIFLIGFASAEVFTFDNKLTYSDNDKTVLIENRLDLIGSNDIAEVTLLSPLHQNLARGYQEVARFNITGFIDYKDFIEEITLEDMKKERKEFLRDHDLKKVDWENVLVEDYADVCDDYEKMANCVRTKIGEHYELREVYTKLTPADLKKYETLTITLWTEVKKGDYVDWKPTFAGKKIDKWATWSESLNTNLVGYYAMDEGTGNAIDSYGSNDLYEAGTIANQSGKIASSRGAYSTSNYFRNDAYNNVDEDIDFSASFWVKRTGSISSDETLLAFGSSDSNDFYANVEFDSDNVIRWVSLKVGGGLVWDIDSTGGDTALNTWEHYVVTYSQATTNATIYKNGAYDISTLGTKQTTTLDDGFTIGRREGFGDRALETAYLDEVGYWNRTLTPDEVIDLYNGGDGLPYGVGTPDDPPYYELTSPANWFNGTTNTINIEVEAYDDLNVQNVSLQVNGSIVNTNTGGVNGTYNFNGINLGAGLHNWSILIFDNNSQSNQSINRTVNITITVISPNITLYTPEDNLISDQFTHAISGLSHDDQALDNVTLYVNGNPVNTETGISNPYNYTELRSFGQGINTWFLRAFDNDSNPTDSLIRTLTIDTIDPNIESDNLTGGTTFSLPYNLGWNYQVSDPNIDECYYNTSQNTSYEIVTCNSSITTQLVSSGNKTFYFCANDTVGHETCEKEYVFLYALSTEYLADLNSVVEGFPVTFNLTVSSAGLPVTTATLILNNTVYVPTTVTAGSGSYYFERTITIPTSWGNSTGNFINWSWNYTVTGLTTNKKLDNKTLTVYEMNVDNCTDYFDPIFNFTLYDEELNTEVNGSAGSNIEADLIIYSANDGSVNWSFASQWTNVSEADICIPSGLLTASSPFKVNLTVGYSSTDRVNEFYHLDMGDLNSAKQYNDYTGQEINLMDLKTVDSTSAVFNYFDEDGLAVDGSIVHVFRNYIGEGLFREVERSKANDNGDTVIHVVEEDVIYYFVITKNGEELYQSSTYTILCLTSPCSIEIEASGDGAIFSTDYDLIEGGAYSINSSRVDREVSLVFTLDSPATMNFTLYKYNSDGSYEAIASEEQTASSGVYTLTAPLTAGNVSFFAVLEKDGNFVRSKWIDFEGKAGDYFGNTLSLLLTGLIVLALGLIAVVEGGAVIIFVILGLLFSGALGLVTVNLSTGVSLVIYLIVVGAVILWKLTRRNR